jgi:23S rRNA (uracil1939-C5)-methyltransferase
VVEGLSIRDRLPQIELAAGEAVDVLVLRVLEPPSPEDEVKLKTFADAHRIQFWLQPKGPDTAHPFHPLDAPELAYGLPEFNLVMPFRPTEFTQVNHGINRMLIRRAMRLLDPRPGERIADFFCGLGNFSLPIARRGASVVGIEGSKGLVERAGENAARNGLSQLTEFRVADLFQITPEAYAELGEFDKLLIDPPRDGAIELVKSLPERDATNGAPRRIVYVSCGPATLARDAAVLVHQKGYRLVSAGVANMFPHTAHVESIALFER